MTRKEIVNEVYQKTGINKEAIQAVVDETINVIAESLVNGESIFLRGLFTLSVVKRAPKHTRNITKNEDIMTPAHYAPHAKFAKELKEKIKEIPIE